MAVEVAGQNEAGGVRHRFEKAVAGVAADGEQAGGDEQAVVFVAEILGGSGVFSEPLYECSMRLYGAYGSRIQR